MESDDRDDAEVGHESRPPFHPLRAVDLVKENGVQLLFFVSALTALGLVSLTVPEWVARTGFTLFLGFYLLAFTPRFQLYGNDLGSWPSGELYDRYFGGGQTDD